ncbi:MAG: sugar phosphate isomerase/epimerase family protein [Planctomycetota bacterium]
MRFGITSLLWTSPFTTDDLDLMDRAAEMGFDLFEIGLEQPDRVDYAKVAQRADELGLEVAICGTFGPGRDISSEDAAVRRQGMEYIQECVRAADECGPGMVVGPAYSATGKARMVPDEQRADEWSRAVDNMQECAEYAEENGVTLALEPLNRYETDMVNTAEQAVDFVEQVDSPAVSVHLDTYHMNIEEKSYREAIATAAPHLSHFHASENDRGTPGSGHVNWDEVRNALASAGYDGPMVIESFDPGVEEVAKAASVWRPLAPSPDSLAEEGLRFLREHF